MKKTASRLIRLAAVLPACGALLAACAQQPAAPNPAASQELKAFPAELKGYQRYVIELPALPAESEHQLELIGTKATTVDCNTRGMDGGFEARDVQGWGYTYWVLQSRGQVMATMMACPPGSARPGVVQTQGTLVRYNSKLPVVVFVPEGMGLGYRVWSAGALQVAAPR